MNRNLSFLCESSNAKGSQALMPSWVRPMPATLTYRCFSDQDWIFERKLVGERCLACGDEDSIRLRSRNRQLLNEQYPELVQALDTQLQKRFIVDGEIVAFEDHCTSFSWLQKR